LRTAKAAYEGGEEEYDKEEPDGDDHPDVGRTDLKLHLLQPTLDSVFTQVHQVHHGFLSLSFPDKLTALHKFVLIR